MKAANHHINAALANGAEYLAMGEIAANTGLLVSQAPRNNANYDVIVSSHDLSKSCRVEVKHSHTAFKANISGDHYDFLVFVYAPSDIVDGRIESTAPRQVFVFPQHIVEATDKGKTGVNFNPKNVDCWEGYENNYSQILEYILGTTDVGVVKDIDSAYKYNAANLLKTLEISQQFPEKMEWVNVDDEQAKEIIEKLAKGIVSLGGLAMMAAEAIDSDESRLSGLDALRLTLFSGIRIVEEYMQDEIEENDLDAEEISWIIDHDNVAKRHGGLH